jgi:chemotaxis protein CheX
VITENDLSQIADDIWDSLFAGEAPEEPTGSDGRTMTAVVDINGDWNGSVSISCQRATAVDLAAVMFAAPGPELSRNDIVDALGELANMVGGAVKGLFDGDKTLGLPTVVEGVDFIMSIPHTTQVAGVDHEVATGANVRLAVHEAKDRVS